MNKDTSQLPAEEVEMHKSKHMGSYRTNHDGVRTARRAIAAVLLAAVSIPASAAGCPFLKSSEVVETLLDPPRETTYETIDLKGQDGMKRARICNFKAPGGGIGAVGVQMIDFTSAVAANAYFQKLRKDTSGRIFPLSGVGSAAFIANIPGLSDSTQVLAGSHVLKVSHVLSTKVREAIANNPDGAVIGTHVLAKLAVGRI
jgi:hypothetical protein